MSCRVDAEDSYKLDIFPLPLPPIIQARTRPRRVHGEEQSKRTSERKGTKMELTKKQPNQLPPTPKQAGRTGCWHQCSEKEGGKGLNSYVSGSVVEFVSLGGMVEDAHRRYIVRSSLWIYLQVCLRVFPCYRISLLVARFCWQTSDGSVRGWRVGGQMWRYDTRVEKLPRLHLEPKVDYQSILPDWGWLLRARRAPIIYILFHHGIV